jgi:uncharacterized protein YgiB involved in biofilm formation
VKVRDWVARSWWQLALVGLAAIAVFTYWSTERGSQVRAEAKAEQDQRAYVAKRRGDCYEIFTKERSRFSNAQAPEYDPDDDVCRVRYGRSKPDSSCSNLASVSDTLHFPLLDRRRIDCLTNTFTNEF